MTILITGGSGLVGNAIKNLNYNMDIIFIKSKLFDLTSLNQTKLMFEKYKPSYVIHLAANVGGLYKNMNNKVRILEDNLLINFNVVKCCHDYNVKKLVAYLSTCIYPNDIDYPINENQLHLGPPHFSNEGYSYAKRMLEIHIKKYREEFNDNFVCIIPTNIYGLNDNYNLKNSHVIPALIHKCFLAKKNNTNFVIFGDGSPLRQFIYAKDLAKLTLKILFDNNVTENIILSPSNEISIKEIAFLICDIFKYDKNKIIFNKTYSNGQYKKTVSNDNLKNIYPDFKFTDLKIGLEETILWFINNYDTVRK